MAKGLSSGYLPIGGLMVVTAAFGYMFNQAAKARDAQAARDGVVKALKLIGGDVDESNIVPYDGNNARVLDTSKIDTSKWNESFSLHATRRSMVVPGFDDLEVKLYFNDSERQNFDTIGIVHSGFWRHTFDYFFLYDRHDRSNGTNANIARGFCSKVIGGCP